MIEKNKCHHCGNNVEDDNLICMHCGHPLRVTKKLDTPNSNKIQKKEENITKAIISIHGLWWILLIIGGIVSAIVSLILLFDLL